jgi:2'-5' RNA ligase
MEEKSKHSFGCLMAMIPVEYGNTIIKFIKHIIPEKSLYIDPADPSYGYTEKECHATIKYGYAPDLNKQDLATILRGIKPFNVVLHALTQFNNNDFDVVKFDVESPVLRELRHRADKFPNQDKFPDYKPHMTLAYVKPKSFIHIKEKLNISVPIKHFIYSGANGRKILIHL